MYSLNIDARNPKGNPDVSELKELGVEMVRYTFYDNSSGDNIDPGAADFYRNKAEELRNAGIGSLVILTYDTFPNRPDPNAPDDAYNGYIDQFARRSGQIAQLLAPFEPAFQVWNEPDHPVHPNYVPTLSEVVYARMQKRTYELIKAVDSSFLVVTGGLSQGDPGWLKSVIQHAGGVLHADAVAFHPYGQRPEPNWPDPNWAFGYVGGLITGYFEAGQNKPLWITEMGIKEEDLGNNRETSAEFLRRYYNSMATKYAAKVHELFWFCYSDGMVPTFGLKDEALVPKPIYQAFKQAVEARPPAPPPTPALPEEPQPLPTMGLPPPAPLIPVASRPGREALANLQAENASLKAEVIQSKARMGQLESEILLARANKIKMAELEHQLQQLQAQLQQTRAQAVVTRAGPVIAISPSIQNISGQLKQHASKRWPDRPTDRIQRIVVHHTGIAANVGADRIAALRVDKQDWPGIGYHFFITGDGQIQQTNQVTKFTAHAGNFNSVSVGVCFAGDFNSVSPPKIQINAGAQLIGWLLKQLNLGPQAVSGYKELDSNQASPGAQWDTGTSWGNELRAQIRINM